MTTPGRSAAISSLEAAGYQRRCPRPLLFTAVVLREVRLDRRRALVNGRGRGYAIAAETAITGLLPFVPLAAAILGVATRAWSRRDHFVANDGHTMIAITWHQRGWCVADFGTRAPGTGAAAQMAAAVAIAMRAGATIDNVPVRVTAANDKLADYYRRIDPALVATRTDRRGHVYLEWSDAARS